MALEEGTIIFNYQRALGQANELDEIAESLKNLASNDFDETLQNISANWKGDNAINYLSKGKILEGKMNTTSRSLNGIANDIRKIAKQIYDTEMKNLEIARSREYQVQTK